ncbi:hypothetical protein [Neptunomonas phycophila]|uniref:hypothetical protein n=1 Tax=Neptunomonas phycophila TaxID=1572645 RepID=UPI0035172E40
MNSIKPLKELRKKQGGFGLMQIAGGLVVLGIMSKSVLTMKNNAAEKQEFEALGTMIADYEKAVALWIVDQGGSALPATYTDTKWLKDKSTCGYSSGGSKAYLPCSFDFTNNPWGKNPTTKITNSAGITKANSQWPTIQKNSTNRMAVGAAQAAEKAEAISVGDMAGIVSYSDNNAGKITADVNVNNSTSLYVRRSGDTMTGNLNMGSNSIDNVNVLTAVTADFANNVRATSFIASDLVKAKRGWFTNDVAVGGDLSVNDIDASGSITVDSRVTAANVYTGRLWDKDNSSYYVDPASVSKINGIIATGTSTISKLNGNLQITATATKGNSCSGTGRLAVTTTGALLTCQSGKWESAQSSSSESGIKGVLTPLKGMTITCAVAGYLVYGKVDSDGVPWVKVASGSYQRGNYIGMTTVVSSRYKTKSISVKLDATGIAGSGVYRNDEFYSYPVCHKLWP